MHPHRTGDMPRTRGQVESVEVSEFGWLVMNFVYTYPVLLSIPFYALGLKLIPFYFDAITAVRIIRARN